MRRIVFTVLGGAMATAAMYYAYREKYDRATYNLVLAIWTFDNAK